MTFVFSFADTIFPVFRVPQIVGGADLTFSCVGEVTQEHFGDIFFGDAGDAWEVKASVIRKKAIIIVIHVLSVTNLNDNNSSNINDNKTNSNNYNNNKNIK